MDLIQLDILECALLKKEFDIIECCGVLHHMQDPLLGLRTLSGLLSDNGYIKLALYSELGRKGIAKARDYININQIDSDIDGIRNFRRNVFSGKCNDIDSLFTWAEFFSLSECRDLCFHAKEHRFTIEKLNENLNYCGLKFHGFVLPLQIKSLYMNNFPADKQLTSLDNWHKFEKLYPDTFKAMYNFWASKK